MQTEKPRKRLVGWTPYLMPQADKQEAVPEQLLRATEENRRHA